MLDIRSLFALFELCGLACLYVTGCELLKGARQ